VRVRHKCTRALGVVVGGALLLASCALGSPTPAVTPTSEHHEVLLIGDSLMLQVGSRLSAAFAAEGVDARVVNGAINGLGLLDPVNSVSPTDYVLEQLRDHPTTDTVLVQLVGNCLATCQAAFEPGTDAFSQAWVAAALQMIDAVHEQFREVRVVWTVSPQLGGSLAASALSPDASRVLSFYDRAALGAEVDWWTAFNDTNGAYRQTLAYEGAAHTVRADDHVHFTSDGAWRAAQWTVAGLTRVWAHP
jgi:hypothetical protein